MTFKMQNNTDNRCDCKGNDQCNADVCFCFFFRVRDTPFGSGVCGCANLIKSSKKIAVKVGSGDNYACLSLFSGKMSLFDTR